jgi:hypothetical protein
MNTEQQPTLNSRMALEASAPRTEKSVYVTGWRVGLEVWVGMTLLVSGIELAIYLKLRTFTALDLERLSFMLVASVVIGALVAALLWQRVELNAERQTIRVRNLNTLWRWREFHVPSLQKLLYFTYGRGLNSLLIVAAQLPRVEVSVLEDSMFAYRGSRFVKALVGFAQRGNSSLKVSFD